MGCGERHLASAVWALMPGWHLGHGHDGQAGGAG